jgi:hypothetical protein
MSMSAPTIMTIAASQRRGKPADVAWPPWATAAWLVVITNSLELELGSTLERCSITRSLV